MEKLLFGTAGIPNGCPKRSSQAGVAYIRKLSLDCMELAFVRRVAMGEKTAAKVRKTAEELEVALSVHGPYYINLNSHEADKVEASRQRILAAARVGWLCGARNIVFHPAYYHDDPPGMVYERVKGHLVELAHQLREERVDIVLRPETTGKLSQFGTLEELVELSQGIDGVAPCVDFAHMHARTGKLNSYEEFSEILSLIEEGLGQAELEDMHIHISGIDYGSKGEKEHLNLADADLRYEALLRAFVDFGVKGLVICESPNLERDALLLKETYRRLKGK